MPEPSELSSSVTKAPTPRNGRRSRPIIQAESGFFAVDAPIYDGDVVLIDDPRGGTDRRLVAKVKIHDYGPFDMRHTEVEWGRAPNPRAAPVRRLGIENLHPEVAMAASDLFVDGHYSQAIFERSRRWSSGCGRRATGVNPAGI
jgi:hypothetical protein